MYTILTTCPDFGSRNVGDKLIEVRLREIIEAEFGPTDYLTIFREESLDEQLDRINATSAILMPGLPIRDTPMHPNTYRLVEDLSRIHPPMIPIGANWNVYPGDAWSRAHTRYSEKTLGFLRHLAGQVRQFSCREHYVCDVLARHGIENGLLTGDPAMFRLSHIGRPMHRPSEIGRVVFSPPLSPFYADQALAIMETLAKLFPEAQKLCAFHLADPGVSTEKRSENSAAMTQDVGVKNRRIRERAIDLGFDVLELAGNFEKLKLYDDCDLHVGYECHAHLYFLSSRLPSVLIAEDARGVGFNYTFGVGGFDGFVRAQYPDGSARKTVTSGYCTTLAELAPAPPSLDVHRAIEQFLREELGTRFRRYLGLADWLDETFEKAMQPFIRTLPRS